MRQLKDAFTSTGKKFFAHEEAMRNLANGKGQAITTHAMISDLCNHRCAFCSVATRAGDVLKSADVLAYLGLLLPFGLKSVILSGGGNPLLYKCPETKIGISEIVLAIHDLGLEIGMITNGMPLKKYDGRLSYATLTPEALDCLTWLRVSMAGLDHEEAEVYVPEVDGTKTTLGFSYVYHDIYDEPLDKNHGKVSTVADLISLKDIEHRVRRGKDRLFSLTCEIGYYAQKYRPKYVRLLPNCLEPDLIQERCTDLGDAAALINQELEQEIVFVQYKPPAAPKSCYLGYVHPVLNSDGYIYPCDSCVLNAAADHKFASPWRVCHWSEVEKIYREPVRSLIADPHEQCPGCVFTESNRLLEGVVEGRPYAPTHGVEHVNFV